MSRQSDFVNAYLEHAKRSELRTGIPAVFSLAQSALESGWASAKPGNAMFGIKATGSWHGKKQLLTTREVFLDRNQGRRFPEVISITPRRDGKFDYIVKDWFRAYDSPAESFDDHGTMLRGNARYAAAFLTTDPREFARRIAAGGYATDPNYAASLINLIGELEKLMPPPATPWPGAFPNKSNPPLPRPSPATAPAKRSWIAALLEAILSLFKRR